jgi:hypothetical protein
MTLPILKWIFSKRIAQDDAIVSYLCMFEESELAYMADVLLQTYHATPIKFSDVDVLSYMISERELRANFDAGRRRSLRSQKRAKLVKAANSAYGKPFREVLKIISPFHSGTAVTYDQERRLGLHLTMLKRIHSFPTSAPYLPELDVYNEGVEWVHIWGGP